MGLSVIILLSSLLPWSLGAGGCPDGWVEDSGSCYEFSQEEKNWRDATRHCRNNGAHLVSIGSQEEHDFVFQNIDTWVWTGGHNLEGRSPPKWTWSDRTPWDYECWFNINNQNSGKFKGIDTCVMTFSVFAAVPCDQRKRLRFVCEKEGRKEASAIFTTISPIIGNNTCPTGLKKGSRGKPGYQWFFNKKKTWVAAERHCQTLNGHLVSIKSEEERKLIQRTLLGTVWIGGRWIGGRWRNTNSWTWTDDRTEIKNADKISVVNGGKCLVTFAGRFSGFDCNQERLYICKYNF